MFDKIIDLLIAVWKDIWFFQTIYEYEEGVKLRLGKYHKSLKPGIWFKWSVAEKILVHYAKDDTILLPSQKLTTKDGKTITARGVILYKIDDIKLFLTEVNQPQQAISDMAMGMISNNITTGNYEDCYNDKIMNEITKDVRREAKRWGAYVTYVKLTDISLSRTFNISKESESHI